MAAGNQRQGSTARVVVAAIVVLAAAALLFVVVKRLIDGTSEPRRQTAKIAILPDAPPPPPPPPPPKEEPKKEPPKEIAAKPQPQEQPKPAPAPPANEPMKMEGAAGSGESPFAAGTVTREASAGGSTGGASAPAAGTGSDRARERFYANTARQLLRDEIERQLRPEAGELTATFALWVEPDGRIRRYELQPGEDPKHDSDMQAALAGTARELRLPPPDNLPQPLRFRLTVRSQG